MSHHVGLHGVVWLRTGLCAACVYYQDADKGVATNRRFRTLRSFAVHACLGPCIEVLEHTYRILPKVYKCRTLVTLFRDFNAGPQTSLISDPTVTWWFLLTKIIYSSRDLTQVSLGRASS